MLKWYPGQNCEMWYVSGSVHKKHFKLTQYFRPSTETTQRDEEENMHVTRVVWTWNKKGIILYFHHHFLFVRFSSALESDYRLISKTSSFLCIPCEHSWHMVANVTLCYTSVELLSLFPSAQFTAEKLLIAIAFLQVLCSSFPCFYAW